MSRRTLRPRRYRRAVPTIDRVRPAPASRRRSPGWVPNQHGAWAMLLVPFVVGALHSGLAWRQLPLLGVWLVGYFAFFAAGLWLKSRRKARYLPPVRAYGIATAGLGLLVVAVTPELLRWVPVYAPLMAVSLWCSWRRQDRSYLNDGVTIVAACLMTVVAAGVGADAGGGDAWLPGADQPGIWLLTGLLLAYFGGTVLYVKSLIRERGNRAVYAASVGYHVLATVAAAVAQPWLGVVFALFTVRAALVPRLWPGLTARWIGIGEVVASIVLTTALLALV